MNIGILGAGNVGGTLARAWARRGHEIVIGVRDPDSPKTRETVEGCGGKARGRRGGSGTMRSRGQRTAVRGDERSFAGSESKRKSAA